MSWNPHSPRIAQLRVVNPSEADSQPATRLKTNQRANAKEIAQTPVPIAVSSLRGL